LSASPIDANVRRDPMGFTQQLFRYLQRRRSAPRRMLRDVLN